MPKRDTRPPVEPVQNVCHCGRRARRRHQMPCMHELARRIDFKKLKGLAPAIPEDCQRPPTRTSPFHSVVLKTPGLTTILRSLSRSAPELPFRRNCDLHAQGSALPRGRQQHALCSYRFRCRSFSLKVTPQFKTRLPERSIPFQPSSHSQADDAQAANHEPGQCSGRCRAFHYCY